MTCIFAAVRGDMSSFEKPVRTTCSGCILHRVCPVAMNRRKTLCETHSSRPTKDSINSPKYFPTWVIRILWALIPGGIYFVPAEAPRSVRYYDFISKQICPIFEWTAISIAASRSPHDGRWILYSLENDVDGDIMLVDHFH